MSSLGLLPEFILQSSPVIQGIWGTLFTWFVTALGSALVFLIPEDLSEEKEGLLLDGSLGFAAGVMLAASYWSLLAPAIELSEEANYKEYSFVPAAFGFFLGALFVFLSDILLPEGADSFEKLDGIERKTQEYLQVSVSIQDSREDSMMTSSSPKNGFNNNNKLRQRRRNHNKTDEEKIEHYDEEGKPYDEEGNPSSSSLLFANSNEVLAKKERQRSCRRLFLLVVAVTIHNFPEGLAVGVGFGAVGKTKAATIEAAELLAFGIGIQNFPEGLAVSLPMRRMGYSKFWCFFFGQLSGMVEPIGGYLGAAAVQYAEPILPYALSFAAGAMVYVVVDSIIPEAQTRGNSKIASWGTVIGFLVMMCLDVGLG